MLKPITIILITTLTLNSCSSFSGTGTSTALKESSNKRHNKKAILFLREADATVADSYQVTIVESSHILGKAEVGNTFTVDTNHGQTILNAASINFTWLADDTLQIDYDKKLRTFIQETRVADVTIIYVAK